MKIDYSSSVESSSSYHFLGALKTKSKNRLTNSSDFSMAVTELLKFLDVTCLGVQIYKFNNNEEQCGFTAIFLLAESHIAIHTWPEYSVAELDVYLCNYLNDNRKKCEAIFDGITDFFEPIKITKTLVNRPRADQVA
jgi:S-adenosylmethionine decarboxylase